MSAYCYFCGITQREVRPYGPGGSMVCLPCVKGTPEREAAAKGAYGALLDAASAISGSSVVAIGTDEGPTPWDMSGGDA